MAMLAQKQCTLRRYVMPLLQLLCLNAQGAMNDGQPACGGLDLFGSKTGYSDLLGKCLTLESELFDGSSLESRHKELTKGQLCKPIGLFLIGRHAARQPSQEELAEIGQNLGELLNLMRSSQSSNLFLRWRSPFHAEQADLVTELGAQRHRELAHRLKQIYPEFFRASKTHVELATTSKIRTVQSGVEFLKEVDNFELSSGPKQQQQQQNESECEFKRKPKDFSSGKFSDLSCFKGILPLYRKIELEFHKDCKRRIKQSLAGDRATKRERVKIGKDIVKSIAHIKQSFLEEIAGRIKRKFGLKAVPSGHAVSSAYETCIYETSAIYGRSRQSVWCKLFEREDLESLEYLEDAKIFHKTSQNRDSYYIQSSPLMRDLLSKLERASSASNTETQAYFGFTHDGVMKKFLAALGLFDDDKRLGYTMADLQAFESARLVPKRRLWRSSLMVPFSANVLLGLYKCEPAEPAKVPGAATSFKLLSSISERPVILRGCKSSICPLEEFLKRHKSVRSYNDEQVCQEVRNSMAF